MTDKENLESFVTSALRSRIEGSAQSVVELRRHLSDELERVENAIRSSGEKPISIPDELLPAPAPTPAPAEEAADHGALLAHIRSSQEEMLAATEQVALLTHLLTACTVSCPRVAFFIARKDGLVGWAARGFEGIRDAEVRNVTIRFDQDTILGAAHRSASTVHGAPGSFQEDGELLSRLGGGEPAETIAVPVFLRDKIAAVLYGDSGTARTIVDPEVPEVLALHAGLCLETLSTRQKYPRPKPAAAEPVRSARSAGRA
ncbi:MAG TPA: hypothetical protein VNI57_03445, partial [Candidatus Saccharimonadales bacterium]|nr:hypothetical protein [Candidatus Saccharimonadales bacterium]